MVWLGFVGICSTCIDYLADQIGEYAMSIFGADKEQDQRLDAIEEHLRTLTDDLARARLGIAGNRAVVLGLQATIEEKLQADDFDPAIMEFSEQLGKARVVFGQVEAATNEQWVAMQGQLSESLDAAEAFLEEAAEKLNSDN